MSPPDRTVPLLLSMSELEALLQSVAVMLGALEAEHAARWRSTSARSRAPSTQQQQTTQAIADLRELERHLAATLKAVPS